MKGRFVGLAGALVLLAVILSSISATSQKQKTHSEWVAETLKQIETLKVGMTRADLFKLFTEEGGLSTRQSQPYVWRECPYIKVDVQFEAGNNSDPMKDRIRAISKPYLQWMILD